MKKSAVKVISVLLSALLLGGALCSCGNSVSAVNLSDGIKARSLSSENDFRDSGEFDAVCANAAEFGLKLFRECAKDGKNTLISPLSVLSALAMAFNDAEGNTLYQAYNSILCALPHNENDENGGPAVGCPFDSLNRFLYSVLYGSDDKAKSELKAADSIWFTDKHSLEVNPEFLQINKDYYNAEVYKATFDRSALSDINSWVKKNTGGMIKEILSDISPDAVMYLINALAFEAEWENVYNKNQVSEHEFTCEDGSVQKGGFMSSQESMYLENENSTGFIKYYKGRNYAFAAFLPNEGIMLDDFIDSLDAYDLHDMLDSAENCIVYTKIPKFESSYDKELSEILKSSAVSGNDILNGQGMSDAFSPELADFSKLGTVEENQENIFISSVIHKTFISVNETGTKAAAASAVEKDATCANPAYSKEVYLDRPFVYMVIDCDTDFPVFMGCIRSIGE